MLCRVRPLHSLLQCQYEHRTRFVVRGGYNKYYSVLCIIFPKLHEVPGVIVRWVLGHKPPEEESCVDELQLPMLNGACYQLD